MLGLAEDLLDRSLFDDLALVHDADAVGDLAHDAEVMGDEQHRHAEPGLQVLQQLQDLRLHRDIERGGRLVGDQQFGFVGERHRDHDALALSAGQLMRIAFQPPGRIGNANLGQQFDDAILRRLAAQADMEFENLADLTLDGVERIERGHRLLEDDGDVVAADLAHGALRSGQQFLALEVDRAGWMAGCRIGQQLHHRHRGHGLAGSGFAHQRDGLARVDVERDPVDRERRPSGLGEGRPRGPSRERSGGTLMKKSSGDRRRRAPPRR